MGKFKHSLNLRQQKPGADPSQRGQSFVELVIMMPILILLIAGMTEVVFVFNDFLQMLDGVRYGARFTSDSNPYPTDTSSPGAYDSLKDCTTTLNFFREAACLTNQGLKPITLVHGPASRTRNIATGQCQSPTPPQDDIVISIFGTHVWDPDADGTNQVDTVRYYNNSVDTSVTPNVGSLVVDDTANPIGADSGWSYMDDWYGSGGMCSHFTFSQVTSLLLNTAPSTGVVLVEVYYNHAQLFDLPIFGDLVPNPIPLWSYAFFPLVSAEPTLTPIP